MAWFYWVNLDGIPHGKIKPCNKNIFSHFFNHFLHFHPPATSLLSLGLLKPRENLEEGHGNLRENTRKRRKKEKKMMVYWKVSYFCKFDHFLLKILMSFRGFMMILFLLFFEVIWWYFEVKKWWIILEQKIKRSTN